MRDKHGRKVRFATTQEAVKFCEAKGLAITEFISERGQMRLNVLKDKQPYTLVIAPR